MVSGIQAQEREYDEVIFLTGLGDKNGIIEIPGLKKLDNKIKIKAEKP